MTRWLALDTSTWWGGIALLEDDGSRAEPIAEMRVLVRDSHAARLLGAVEALLQAAGWERQSLGAFAAVRGPGSFTGIRVGLGLLRGLSVASGKPCVGVDALEAHAEAFGATRAERIPLLDASRGEVYGARYDAASSPPAPVVAPWLGVPEMAAAPGGAAGVVFGPAVDIHRERLERVGLFVAEGPPPDRIAVAAGRIASHRLRNFGRAASELSPLYLRPSDAELGRR